MAELIPILSLNLCLKKAVGGVRGRGFGEGGSPSPTRNFLKMLSSKLKSGASEAQIAVPKVILFLPKIFTSSVFNHPHSIKTIRSYGVHFGQGPNKSEFLSDYGESILLSKALRSV